MTIQLDGMITFKEDGSINFTGTCPNGITRLATPLADAIQAECAGYREVGMKTAKITIQIEPQ